MIRVAESEPSGLVTRLCERLIRESRPGGGWGYSPGKASRIEPTAWALLALAGTKTVVADAWPQFVSPHLAFLGACQRFDGLLLDIPNGPPNLTSNAVAALVLAHLAPTSGPSLRGLLVGLMTVRGIKVDVSDPRQNNQLQGWPWLPSTFSWVEPTAWCVLALKKAPPVARPASWDDRVREAETLLENRSCESGGWNFGNASVLGQDLRPYVSTTALGLLALQDRRTPVVDRSLAYLERARLNEPTAMALSLTALCLRTFGRPVQDVEESLAHDVSRLERRGNLHALAMAAYALAGDRERGNAFHV